MKKIKGSPEQLYIAKQLLNWTILILPLSIAIGLIVALFLWLLDAATTLRWAYAWLLFFLPLAGVLIVFLYSKFGKRSSGGNNLIMDEIHKAGGGIPGGMTPLILFSTVITHLFGGSAGREGTAIQMGGSISSFFAKLFKVKSIDKRIMLMCGMSAGFGAVFGTPVTGTIFALEVLTIGRIKYDALIPCFIAGVIAHITCISCGIVHTHYHIDMLVPVTQIFPGIHFDLLLLGKTIGAGVMFGLVSNLFSKLSHLITNKSSHYIKNKYLIPVIGSALIIVISYSLGTFDYLGLGVTSKEASGISIVNAFTSQNISSLSWFWKLLLTAITLGMGFKGGEVTPLFFIGATLGNTIAVLTHSPIDLFAALGFIAVFAGATNTPLACTIMGVELFGGDHIIYYAIACFTAYYFSGHSGIYHSQRVAVSKFHKSHTNEPTITQLNKQ